MPKTIDKLRKAKVKQARLQGKSNAQALREAGYSDSTAKHNVDSGNKLLKAVLAEIEAEWKLSDVTVDSVLKELEAIQEAAFKKGDNATAGRMAELKGKYLAMFTDKQQLDAKVMSQQEDKAIKEYMQKSSNRIEGLLND